MNQAAWYSFRLWFLASTVDGISDDFALNLTLNIKYIIEMKKKRNVQMSVVLQCFVFLFSCEYIKLVLLCLDSLHRYVAQLITFRQRKNEKKK